MHNNDLLRLKLAEEKGSKSEELFRKAFSTSPDSVNINRLSDGIYISINKGFTKLLGYSEDEVIGKSSIDLNIWADTESRKKLVTELKDKKRVENFEARFRSKDGFVIYGLMSASLIDLDGVPCIINITRDITQRRKIDETLAREQFLVNALMNNLTDHIYFKDLESRFIRINKSHALSFGLDDPAQVIGKSDFDFFTKEHARQAYEDEQNIIRTGQSLSIEEKETHPDSPDTWASTVKMPLQDKDGNIVGTFGISRDITERQRRELESSVFYEISEGITSTSNLDELLKLIHKSIGKVVYAENCFVALFNQKTGLFSFPYFVDKIDTTPEPTSMTKSCTAYVFKTGKSFLFTNEVFDQLEEQGEVELIGYPSPSWIGIPLQTPSKIIGVLVLQHYEKENVYSARDEKFLTSIGSQIAVAIDRKMSEEEIKLKNEMLQAINAEKDKFFSIIAHDLRGPLSSFVAATQIITEEIQTMSIEEIKDITLSMKASATGIYSLLENLLEWSRLMRGGMDFVPIKINLRKKVLECVDVLSESARNKEIEIEITIPDDIEILADNHMFETLVRNLVSNSLKFTNRGGKITLSSLIDKMGFVEVSVKDTGIGMSAGLKDKLFKLSEKTNRPGTAGESSTGLGLLLCKEFIEKNGGTIWVESEVGKGSTFTFTIGQSPKSII